MVPVHDIFVVTLVSQTTSALFLALLAWGDRRTRGITPLAVACGLHAVAVFFMPLWRDRNQWPLEALGAAMLPLLFLLVQRGLCSLVQREQPGISLRSDTWVVAGVMVACVGLAPWTQLWSMQVARVAAAWLAGSAAWKLWRTEKTGRKLLCRGTALLLSSISLTLLVRLPLEPHVPPSAWLLGLREATMVEITLLPFTFLAMYLAESKRRLHQETRMDALTGLLNRRGMEERAAQEVQYAQRSRGTLALLMMDLDEFKLLNDTWGHGVGDRALRAVGGVLLAATQESRNTVARLGGEEFAMMLPLCELETARNIAERLRAAVATLAVLEGDFRVTFTVSIGVASLHPMEKTWAEMLHRADTALYQAKRSGRNRVEVCTETVERVQAKRPSWRLRTARSLRMPEREGWLREQVPEAATSVGTVRD